MDRNWPIEKEIGQVIEVEFRTGAGGPGNPHKRDCRNTWLERQEEIVGLFPNQSILLSNVNYVFVDKIRGATMAEQHLDTLSYFERKEYEELKYEFSVAGRRRRDRAIYMGFFAVSLISALVVCGALDVI